MKYFVKVYRRELVKLQAHETTNFYQYRLFYCGNVVIFLIFNDFQDKRADVLQNRNLSVE